MEEETTAAPAPPKPYKAFISYSHAADDLLAPTLQSALQSFAKPWYRFRAVRVFRDRTNLSVRPDLWGSIEEAVRGSEFFLLLASPEAARSAWVAREIEAFLDSNTSERLIIVLTGGALVWDEAAKDFVHGGRSAFPRLGRSVFDREPKWEDLSRAAGEEHLSLRNPAFHDAVASISSTIRDIPLDEITGRDVIEHKRTKRIVQLVVAALVFLLACVAAAALVAYSQARVAEARRIAAEAALFSSREPRLLGVSALLAAESLSRYPSIEAQETLAEALQLLPRPAAVVRHRDPVRAVAFTPDGERLITADSKGLILVSEAKSGERVTELDLKSPVEAIAVIPGRRAVAAVTTKILGSSLLMRKEVTVWPWADAGADARKFQLESPVTAYAFSPGGRYIAAAFEPEKGGHSVIVYDLGSGACVAAVKPESESRITAVAFSANGYYLAAGQDGGEISLWSRWATDSPGLEHSLTARGAVQGIAFDGETRHVACSTYKNTLHVWNIVGWAEAAEISTDFAVGDITYNAQGDCIAGREGGRSARVWCVSDGVRERAQFVSAGDVNAVAFQPGSDKFFERYVATASSDGTARLWDYGTALTDQTSRERVRASHAGPVNAVAFSPDGGLLATAGDDGAVRVWRVRDTPSLVQFRHWRDADLPLAFDGGQDGLLTADEEATLYTWSLDGKVAKNRWPGPQYLEALADKWKVDSLYTEAVALSPDGSRLAMIEGAVRDLKALPWVLVIVKDTSSMNEVVEPFWLPGNCEKLSFAYGGRYLVISLSGKPSYLGGRVSDAVIELGDTTGIAMLAPLHGEYKAAVSSGGRYVARLIGSGGPSGQLGSLVILRDLRAGRFVRLPPPAAPIKAVAFSPDESLMAIGVGNTIELRELPSGKLLHLARMEHRGTVEAVAFSEHGEYLASTGADATLRVWSASDGAELSRTQMPQAASQVVFSPSPSYKYLATFAEGGGARVWLWRTKDLLDEAAARLPANLSREEWQRYVGEESYRKTFPNRAVPDE